MTKKALLNALAGTENLHVVLSNAPEAFLDDPDIALHAVSVEGDALQYFTRQARTREVCLAAVRNDGAALSWVPENLRDREICEFAVKNWGLALQHVPEGLRDRGLCLLAVRSDGEALEFVPAALRDRAVCLAALSTARAWVERGDLDDAQSVMRNVPNSLRDREMFDMAGLPWLEPRLASETSLQEWRDSDLAGVPM